MKTISLVSTIVTACLTAATITAQTTKFGTGQIVAPGGLDSTFTPQPIKTSEGLTFGKISAQLQADGKLLLQGINFTTLDSSFVGYDLIRLNADGTPDTTFRHGIGFDADLEWEGDLFEPPAVQADGRILVLGRFASVEGEPRPQFTRLNPNGSLDRTFVPALPSPPRRLLVQPDGRILLGRFQDPGRTVYLLERLNADGSLDPGFAARLEGPELSSYKAPRIVLQPDGRVLARGWFTRVNGLEHPRLVRLGTDGRVDESFGISAELRNQIVVEGHLAVGRDGRIFVIAYEPGNGPLMGSPSLAVLNSGGQLQFYGYSGGSPHLELPDGSWLCFFGNPRVTLRRMKPDGSYDEDFNPVVKVSHVFPSGIDGRVLVLGWDDSSTTTRLFRLVLGPQFSFHSMTRLSPTQVRLTHSGYYSAENDPLDWIPEIEASSDLESWSPVPPDPALRLWGQGQSLFEFIDNRAPVDGRRFYRARRKKGE